MKYPAVEVKKIPSGKANEVIRMPQGFRREFFSLQDKYSPLDMPITSYRIIFKIISDLKFHQFSTKNHGQMRLFDEEFKTVNNTYARITLNISDITPSRNHASVLKGLNYLYHYRADWYKSKNSKGKEISVFGGIISEPAISDGQISFLLSSYWMEKMITLDQYNETIYNIAWAVKTGKQLVFFLWLLELKPEGTVINFTTLNERFGLNYSTARDLVKGFLKPMKSTFDRNGNKSFNYSIKADKIAIVPYDLNGALLPLKKDTIDSLQVKQKISYYKRRHTLLKEDTALLRKELKKEPCFNLIDVAYKQLVREHRKKEISFTEITGKNFLSMLQNKMNDLYPVFKLSNDIPVCPVILGVEKK